MCSKYHPDLTNINYKRELLLYIINAIIMKTKHLISEYPQSEWSSTITILLLGHLIALMQNRNKYTYLPLFGPAIGLSECLEWEISVSDFFCIIIWFPNLLGPK